MVRAEKEESMQKQLERTLCHIGTFVLAVTFGFNKNLNASTEAASPAFVKMTTLARSSEGHDVFKNPQGIAIDVVTGFVIVADSGHHRIAKIAPNGTVTIIA